jgi:Protein of unknown function (DUF3617)
MLVQQLFHRTVVAAVFAVLALPAAFGVHATSLNAKPGAWEITTSTMSTGITMPPEVLAKMPPEQRAKIEKSMQARDGKTRTHVTKSCVTKEELDQDRMLKSDEDQDGRQCSKKLVSKSPTKIVMERTCTGPRPSKSTMVVEAKTPDNMVSTIDMVHGTGAKVHVEINGRWLAASCAEVKGAKDGE